MKNLEDLIRYYMQHYNYTRGQAIHDIKIALDRESKGIILSDQVIADNLKDYWKNQRCGAE